MKKLLIGLFITGLLTCCSFGETATSPATVKKENTKIQQQTQAKTKKKLKLNKHNKKNVHCENTNEKTNEKTK